MRKMARTAITATAPTTMPAMAPPLRESELELCPAFAPEPELLDDGVKAGMATMSVFAVSSQFRCETLNRCLS